MPALPEEKPYTINDVYALSENRRAELIDGNLYLLAAPSRTHQRISMNISVLISNRIREQGSSCEIYSAPFAVFINGEEDIYNYVEPDISVICNRDKLTEKGCSGAPDWIIEIVSPATERIDYGAKLFKYRAAGVREYWIINPLRQIVNVYSFGIIPECAIYGFDDFIPVGISDGFCICMNDML